MDIRNVMPVGVPFMVNLHGELPSGGWDTRWPGDFLIWI
jgi:hypothetical protein